MSVRSRKICLCLIVSLSVGAQACIHALALAGLAESFVLLLPQPPSVTYVSKLAGEGKTAPAVQVVLGITGGSLSL